MRFQLVNPHNFLVQRFCSSRPEAYLRTPTIKEWSLFLIPWTSRCILILGVAHVGGLHGVLSNFPILFSPIQLSSGDAAMPKECALHSAEREAITEASEKPYVVPVLCQPYVVAVLSWNIWALKTVVSKVCIMIPKGVVRTMGHPQHGVVRHPLSGTVRLQTTSGRAAAHENEDVKIGMTNDYNMEW